MHNIRKMPRTLSSYLFPGTGTSNWACQVLRRRRRKLIDLIYWMQLKWMVLNFGVPICKRGQMVTVSVRDEVTRCSRGTVKYNGCQRVQIYCATSEELSAAALLHLLVDGWWMIAMQIRNVAI